MNAFELLLEVEKMGGSVSRDGERLVVTSGKTLPLPLLDEIKKQKPAVMVALGAPFDHAIASILDALRPKLPRAVQDLDDAQILALVNWSVMMAWVKTVRELESRR